LDEGYPAPKFDQKNQFGPAKQLIVRNFVLTQDVRSRSAFDTKLNKAQEQASIHVTFLRIFVERYKLNIYSITMKKLSLFAMSLLLSAAAFAQQPANKEHEPKTPEERAKFQTEKMASELQLSAAQKEQVYTINLGIAQKNEGIRTSNFSEEEKRSIIKSNREAQIEMLKNVLTAAQFEKMKAEMKDHPQGGQPHNEKH
jgi:hypothetical protein